MSVFSTVQLLLFPNKRMFNILSVYLVCYRLLHTDKTGKFKKILVCFVLNNDICLRSTDNCSLGGVYHSVLQAFIMQKRWFVSHCLQILVETFSIEHTLQTISMSFLKSAPFQKAETERHLTSIGPTYMYLQLRKSRSWERKKSDLPTLTENKCSFGNLRIILEYHGLLCFKWKFNINFFEYFTYERVNIDL